ncbi:MAG: hypothetical protein QNJ44_01565 [Rhodobacter sp.]|nr:hypothetical protein [Rhodobacter sp.]
MARRSKIVPFSRDYRRPPKWGMGLPKRRGQRRRGPLSGLGAKVVLGLVLLLLVIGTAGDAANGWIKAASDCRVLKIVDGDTVTMSCRGQWSKRARIRGLDTPELYSPGCPSEYRRAVAATYALRWTLLTARRISIFRDGYDIYDRALIRLRVDGVNVSIPMISGGWARSYDGGERKGWCA